MAGDWIKIRTSLVTHPKVAALSLRLCITPAHALGACVVFWAHADAHSDDGALDFVTPEALDALLGLPGFAAALIDLEWLELSERGVLLPSFDVHNGTSAKKRAEHARRARASRAGGCASAAQNAHESAPREEKRREDQRSKTPQPPKGGEGAHPSESAPRYALGFEQFWTAYPAGRKVRKAAAYRCWKRMTPADREAAIEAAAEYAASAEGAGQFVRSPTPWLNGRCWDDDRAAWASGGGSSNGTKPKNW